MTTWDFPCSDPADISIDSWAAGSIVVSGEPTETLAVEVVPSPGSRGAGLLDEVEVDFTDGQLAIRGPRAAVFARRAGLDLTIKAPAGSSCAAKTASAGLSCVGTLSAVSMSTASGDLSAPAVTGDVRVKTASGEVTLGAAGGNLTVNTASGDVRAAQVDGDVRAHSASGGLTVGYCGGAVSGKTASGDVRLGAVVSGDIELTSASGDIEVAVVPGTGVYLDLSTLSGSVRSELTEVDGDQAAADGAAVVQISARTLSGDIRITRSATGRRDPAGLAPAGA